MFSVWQYYVSVLDKIMNDTKTGLALILIDRRSGYGFETVQIVSEGGFTR